MDTQSFILRLWREGYLQVYELYNSVQINPHFEALFLRDEYASHQLIHREPARRIPAQHDN